MGEAVQMSVHSSLVIFGMMIAALMGGALAVVRGNLVMAAVGLICAGIAWWPLGTGGSAGAQVQATEKVASDE